MIHPIDRRRFLGVAAATGFSAELATRASRGAESEGRGSGRDGQHRRSTGRRRDRPETDPAVPDRGRATSSTSAGATPSPSRSRARPSRRPGSRRRPGGWRSSATAPSEVARPGRLEDGTALDLAGLKELGEDARRQVPEGHAVQQHPLRRSARGSGKACRSARCIRRVGKVGNVRRVYYWGFHNDDPAQLFQSSLAYNRVMETPPWEPPPLVAYRLNGEDIPLERGGPVRMVVPWAHGFKSIKWLQQIVLTNDYKANDTYALQNNDPESYLKTAAYLGKGSLVLQGRRADRHRGNGDGRLVGAQAGRVLAAPGDRGQVDNLPTTTRPGRRRSGAPAS